MKESLIQSQTIIESYLKESLIQS